MATSPDSNSHSNGSSSLVSSRLFSEQGACRGSEPAAVTYTPVAAGPWMRIATADGSGVDGVSVTRW